MPRLIRTIRRENVIPVIAISVDVGPGVTVTVPVPTLAEIPAEVSVDGSLMPMSTRNALGSTAFQNPSNTTPFNSCELPICSLMVNGLPVICGGISVNSAFVHWSRPLKSFHWAWSGHHCQSWISPWKATIVWVSFVGQVQVTALQSALTPCSTAVPETVTSQVPAWLSKVSVTLASSAYSAVTRGWCLPTSTVMLNETPASDGASVAYVPLSSASAIDHWERKSPLDCDDPATDTT